MSITRRTAIQALAGAGATAVLPASAQAAGKAPAAEAQAMLYDPVRCVGCKACIEGCAEANGCDVGSAVAPTAQLTPTTLSVLRRHEIGGVETFMKMQCMHCVDPACVSACMLGAMKKNADGSVTWDGDLCVGCRYCQIGCPFNVPRFEWDTPLPKLAKCEFCPERRAAGQQPACVEHCLRGALQFGPRQEMLAEARARIAAEPQRYSPEIYGEKEGGGTSVFYLARAGVPFTAMGLPALSGVSVPYLPEKIQHTLYKGMAAPLTLLALFSVVVRRNTQRASKIEAEEAALHEHEHSEPVGGRIVTVPFLILATLAAAGFAGILWRFIAGLGATTNLSDGYPMGLWIAFDVVTGTALACGGYAVALLVYLLNRGKYHPLVRAAVVTSALGYTLGGLSVMIDIGRFWNFYKIPLGFNNWNFNSILLEVALCIMCYVGVLWLEVSPAILEGWKKSRMTLLQRVATTVSPWIEKAMPYIIALGMLLPTMHQSSLGSLMLLAGEKLHPLWRTPLLPLLFLVSCLAMGYAAVVLEATISAKVFKRPSELPMLRALALPISLVLVFYAALRTVDIIVRDQIIAVLRMDALSMLFLLEMALLTLPALALLAWRHRAGAFYLCAFAVAVILGGGLYRFSTFLIAFNPGAEWSYWPHWNEFMVTVGLVAAEILGYAVLVKKFPILRGAPTPDGDGHAHVPNTGTGGRSPLPALATGAAVLALLLLGASQLSGQARSAARNESLRCLTPLTQEHCLPEPMPIDEPHRGICATCHNLQTQPTLADAARTCAGAGCHDRAEMLTPYHRGLRPGVLQNCIGCHPAHDVRITGGGTNCSFCHTRPGVAPKADAARPAATRPVTMDLSFRHTTHDRLDCLSCHRSDIRHNVTDVRRLQDCRGCHHTPRAAVTCTNCHQAGELQQVRRTVRRTFNIRLGSLDRPTRMLSFEHGAHLTADCRTCHAPGAANTPNLASCSTCHEEHHRPTANCLTCHESPAAGTHERTAHLGCGGVGCHDAAPAAIQEAPRTRLLCITCHTTQAADHRPGNCADCHRLPTPKARRTEPEH
jgi:Ni/Fe-hydrogenase subunit HybB-like protein/Fe-S-cluster-containing dehydrogenase component